MSILFLRGRVTLCDDVLEAVQDPTTMDICETENDVRLAQTVTSANPQRTLGLPGACDKLGPVDSSHTG